MSDTKTKPLHQMISNTCIVLQYKSYIMKGDYMYTPKPINTEDVVLDEELLKLAELLAENVHDVWAIGRINEGWTYGEHRNDAKKQTPCLVPYSDLPESEKEYDRNTALSTIKAIIALGYRIERNNS